MSAPLAVLASGLVCGLGLTAEESCAAIRCGINNFQETRFIGQDGEWLIASVVTLEEPWRGHAKRGSRPQWSMCAWVSRTKSMRPISRA